MQQSPTADEWIALGFQTTDLLDRVAHVVRLFNECFRKSDPQIRRATNYWKAFNSLRWDLDAAVCGSVPRNVHTLPGHDDVPLVTVFTTMGREDGPRFKPSKMESVGGTFQQLPRALTDEQRHFVLDTIDRTNAFTRGPAAALMTATHLNRYDKKVAELLAVV